MVFEMRAHQPFRQGGITRRHRLGQQPVVIPDGLHAGPSIANVAYGGDDRRTLYIVESASGSILTARLPVAGQPMVSHMAAHMAAHVAAHVVA